MLVQKMLEIILSGLPKKRLLSMMQLPHSSLSLEHKPQQPAHLQTRKAGQECPFSTLPVPEINACAVDLAGWTTHVRYAAPWPVVALIAAEAAGVGAHLTRGVSSFLTFLYSSVHSLSNSARWMSGTLRFCSLQHSCSAEMKKCLSTEAWDHNSSILSLIGEYLAGDKKQMLAIAR